MKISNDTVALVTGASRGLGYATALELARQGAHVIAVAKTVGGLEDLADAIDETGGSCTLVPLDITDDAGLQRMCLAIYERWGRLDLLVHCAVVGYLLSPVGHISEKDFEKMWAINVKATQRLMALTEPLLKASEAGTAVFMENPVAGKPFHGAFGATMAAANALAQSWIAETQRIGPRVLTFAPEAMPTALRSKFHPGEDRESLSTPAEQAVRLLDQI